jgi:7-cyano-7-deazaguanine synthase
MTHASTARAVVLVSGGMDSAVTLAIARERGFVCHALSVDYGQRHASELAAAARTTLQAVIKAHPGTPLEKRARDRMNDIPPSAGTK